MYPSLSLLAVGLTVAAAKTITIDVGKGGLVFSPDSSTAQVGDTLEFHFFSSLHTAVQGDFNKPCGRAAGGFNSGPIKNSADGSGSVFQVQVKDTNPIYFYCSTVSHCQSGMVGAINAPSSGNTLDAFKSAAASTSSSDSSPSVQGGVVVPVGTNPSGGTSSSASPADSTPVSPSKTASSTPSTAPNAGPYSSAASLVGSAGKIALLCALMGVSLLVVVV